MKTNMISAVVGDCESLSCQVRPPLRLRTLLQTIRSASPGPQDTEAAISFSNWDVFWYTRNFPSMETDRSRRHASKLLTYPVTIGSVIHQYSALTLGNQRLTPEGSRSLAGGCTNIYKHVHNLRVRHQLCD